MDRSASSELSPGKTRQVMMVFAVAIAGLIGLAVFSLSKLSSTPWNSSLKDPEIQDTLRQAVPQFHHEELGRALTPNGAEGKWSLLTFWSVTCAPCIEELPALNALAATWQGPPFQILTVNIDGDNAEALENAKLLLQEEQITLPTFFDKSTALKNAFQVTEYPKHFLISPAKQIVWQAVGAFKWNDTKARDQLLKLMERRAPEASGDPGE